MVKRSKSTRRSDRWKSCIMEFLVVQVVTLGALEIVHIKEKKGNRFKKVSPKKTMLGKKILGRDLTEDDIVDNSRQEKNESYTLKTGNSVQHISAKPFDQIHQGPLYVSARKKDNELYKAFLGSNLKNLGYDPKTVTLKLKEDLKAPSQKEQKNIFEETFRGKNRDELISGMAKWKTEKKKYSSEEQAKKAITTLDNNKLYDMFVDYLERDTPSAQKFFEEIKKRGYNAVIDEHDITGSWMQAEKPLILFNAMQIIGDITVNELTISEMSVAFDNWLKMKG